MRKTRRFLAVLAAPLLCAATIMMGGPAMAASLSGPPGTGTFFQLESQANNNLCMQEDGTTTAVYLGACSATNHSDLWYYSADDFGETVNLHSGLCLSVTGYDAGVYLHTCVAGQTSQEWDAYGTSEIKNAHTGYCLWQSNTAIQQRNSCDPSNVHDLWTLV